MRIDRAEGAKSYLSKTKTLVLNALGQSQETLRKREDSKTDDEHLTGWSAHEHIDSVLDGGTQGET